MNNNKRKLYEIFLDEEHIESFANSMVMDPAIEQEFIAFSKDEEDQTPVKLRFFEEGDKRMVAGPFVIAGKKILRRSQEGRLYEVVFTRESINDAVKLFAKHKLHDRMTIYHQTNVNGSAYLIETWIVENEQDKIFTHFGYSPEEISIGSWVGVYYIEDDTLWEMVKDGAFKGFSIEGMFRMREVKDAQEMELFSKVEDLLKEDLTDDELISQLTKLVDGSSEI